MIKNKNQIFKCNICGNIVEAVHTGNGELVCCGEPMHEVTENTQEEVATEKHIPVVEKNGEIITVTVGSVKHPMDEEHHIEWVELISGPIVHRRYLNPGEKPKVTFILRAEEFTIRAHCNIHGLWSTE